MSDYVHETGVTDGIADDVEALKDLLAHLREHHWSVQGGLVVGRIQIAGLVDEHPLRQLQSKSRLPTPDDDMREFEE